MGFHYSLQKIVDLKANEKTQAEWILSHAVSILQDEEHQLNSLNSERSELHEDISSTVEISANISQLRLYQSYMNHLESQISKKKLDIHHAEQNVMVKKVHLTDKMIDEKVWSNAKDKAKWNFEAIQRTKEQQILDEMATNRHKHSS
ncbi:MAG: flagellar export protein FliJ [Bacilli bacterium]|nr:flagellar export protein FliJ [Bacilli bacterium]